MSQLSLDLHPSLDYELVVSKRSRRAALRVEPGLGLIVTIPTRFARHRVPEFVEQHRDWIEKTLFEQWKDTPEHYRQWPPRELRLPAIDLTIKLVYRQIDPGYLKRSICKSRDHKWPKKGCDRGGPGVEIWAIESSSDDKVAVASEICRRLKQIAQGCLTQRLAAFADLHSLRYRKVTIRGQRTLWGSFSSTGTLSLNFKLLFLDNVLVDYVLLHELAHTVYLDHSPAFWKLLSRMDVNARTHDKMLSHAGRLVPPWLELARTRRESGGSLHQIQKPG